MCLCIRKTMLIPLFPPTLYDSPSLCVAHPFAVMTVTDVWREGYGVVSNSHLQIQFIREMCSPFENWTRFHWHIATRFCFCAVVSEHEHIFWKYRSSWIICLTVPYVIPTAAAIYRIVIESSSSMSIATLIMNSSCETSLVGHCAKRLSYLFYPLENGDTTYERVDKHCRIPVQIFKMWEDLFGRNSFEI